MDNLILELKAKHFEKTKFIDCRNCAIAKAYTEMTGQECEEDLICIIDIKGKKYYHDKYGIKEFQIDKNQALLNNWDDTVIRTIELIEVIES